MQEQYQDANPFTKNLLRTIKIECRNKYRGCRGKEEVKDIKTHEISCEYEEVACEAFLHCNVTKLRKDINEHLMFCPFVTIECRFR